MKNFFVAVFIAALAFSACEKKPSQNETNASSTEVNSSAVSVEQNRAAAKQGASSELVIKALELKDKGDSFEIAHSLGTAQIPKNPSKVVIFDIAALDTFEALELNDKIVGVTAKTLPKYLEQFSSKPSVGSVTEADLEAVKELEPQLILISGRQAKFFDKLNEIAPTIFVGVNNKDFWNSFTQNTAVLAEIFDKKDQALGKIEALKAKIDAKKANLNKDKKTLILLTNANRISAYGSGSRFGLIHDVLGLSEADTNIKVGTHGSRIDSEYVLKVNPDYIFVVDRNAIVGNVEKAQDAINNELIAKTKAAQNGKIIYLDPEYWYLSGGGLKSLETMIEEVYNAL